MGSSMKKLMTIAVVSLTLAGMASVAFAADPPKWVAAIYVEAQKVVGLRWNVVAGATGYKILRSTTKGSGYAEIGTSTAPQFIDKTLTPGETYFYVLQSVAGGDVSPNSEEKSVVIPGAKKVEVVSPPTWDHINPQQSTEFGKVNFKVGLFWQKSASPNVVAYNVYRSEASGKDYQLVGSVSETQYLDAAVEQDKTYYYVVTALDNLFQETKYSEEKPVTLKVVAQEITKKENAPDNKITVRKSKLIKNVDYGDNYQFIAPGDTAVDEDGNIYVMDVVQANVTVFDANGEFIRVVGGKNSGEENKLAFPLGIGLAPDGTLYVADRSSPGRLVVYDRRGKWLKQIVVPPASEELKKRFNMVLEPMFSDVAVNSKGEIFAIDNAYARLCKFDDRGNYLGEFGGPGTEDGMFINAGWLAINSKDEVHICNGMNRRIEVYDSNGKFLRNYGLSKTFVGSFIGATGIGFDKQDNTWVVDASIGNIQVFQAVTGNYLFTVGDETGDIDQESKQRSTLAIGNPVGISFNQKTNQFVFSLSQNKMFQIRELMP